MIAGHDETWIKAQFREANYSAILFIAFLVVVDAAIVSLASCGAQGGMFAGLETIARDYLSPIYRNPPHELRTGNLADASACSVSVARVVFTYNTVLIVLIAVATLLQRIRLSTEFLKGRVFHTQNVVVLIMAVAGAYLYYFYVDASPSSARGIPPRVGVSEWYAVFDGVKASVLIIALRLLFLPPRWGRPSTRSLD